jgi:hypothetical protein
MGGAFSEMPPNGKLIPLPIPNSNKMHSSGYSVPEILKLGNCSQALVEASTRRQRGFTLVWT